MHVLERERDDLNALIMADPPKNVGEQRAWHRHFGQLEGRVAPVADDLRADLH